MQARAATTAARSVAGTRARPTARPGARRVLMGASTAGRTLASRSMSWQRISCTNRRLWPVLGPARVQTASASLLRCKTMHVSEESCVPALTCVALWSPGHCHTCAASCACIHARSCFHLLPSAQMPLHMPSASQCQACIGSDTDFTTPVAACCRVPGRQCLPHRGVCCCRRQYDL